MFNLQKFKIAICQIALAKQKSEILENVVAQISEASKNGAKLVCLGETFNSIYTKDYLLKAAEDFENDH
jgi:predicted amidohydrolase